MAIDNAPTPTPIEGEAEVAVLESDGMIPWRRVGFGALAALLIGGIAFAQLNSGDTDEQENSGRSTRQKVANRTFDRAPEPAAAALPEIVAAPAAVTPPVVEKEAPPAPPIQPKTIVKYRDRPAPAIPTISKGRSKAVAVQVASNNAIIEEESKTSPRSAQSANAGPQRVNGSSASGGEASDGVTRGYATELQNTDRLLLQGVPIPCTLNNALNTQLAGDASCTVADDIWSADNSRILVAKGSKANGKYQIETTSSAVTRIGVIWGRLRTTDNMVAYLGSNATDPQGATGVPANAVNYHFWEKFGAAFAVSLVEGALRNIGANDTRADVVVNSATGVSSDIASQILAASINMPTTRETLPGTQVVIWMQRDVEFEPLL